MKKPSLPIHFSQASLFIARIRVGVNGNPHQYDPDGYQNVLALKVYNIFLAILTECNKAVSQITLEKIDRGFPIEF